MMIMMMGQIRLHKNTSAWVQNNKLKPLVTTTTNVFFNDFVIFGIDLIFSPMEKRREFVYVCM